MELTKHGHACVVLSDGDRRLVIDPGAFTEPTALDGACELTVCGSLARVTPEERWPLVARDVCPACATLAS